MKLTTTGPVHTGKAWRRASLGLGALGVSVAFLAAPAAVADPPDPAPPIIAPADTVAPQAAPANQVAATDAPELPPAEVPHLSSPDNLPPGTTDTPPQSRGLGYLRDLLHAIRTQDVTANDALLLLAQRPLNANAAPPPGMSASPSGPVGSSAPPPAVPSPAPAADPPAD